MVDGVRCPFLPRHRVDAARVRAQQGGEFGRRALGVVLRLAGRRPAGEHVAAELGPTVEPVGSLPHGGALGQPAAERLRLRPRGPRLRVVLGQEQARAQPGEPGRHAHPLGHALQRHRRLHQRGTVGGVVAGTRGGRAQRAQGRVEGGHTLLDHGDQGQVLEVHAARARLVQQRVERALVAGQPQHGRVRDRRRRILPVAGKHRLGRGCSAPGTERRTDPAGPGPGCGRDLPRCPRPRIARTTRSWPAPARPAPGPRAITHRKRPRDRA